MTEREKVKEMKRDKFNERKSCYAADILCRGGGVLMGFVAVGNSISVLNV